MIKRMMVLSLLLGSFPLPLLAVESYAESLGVTLAHNLVLDKTQNKLYLNGHGVVSLWGTEAYVGALYSPHVEKRADMLLMNDEPLAMVFYFVQDDISADMIANALIEAIVINNHGWDNKKLDKGRLLELKDALNHPFNAGDELMFSYSPQDGVLMQINGEIIHHWPYAKIFFNNLLRMWIGPYPPSRAFKRGILNFPVGM